jgi:hypothetical protein
MGLVAESPDLLLTTAPDCHRTPDVGRDVAPLDGHRVQPNQWTSTFV